MATRDRSLQTLLDALIGGINDKTVPGTDAARALARVEAAIENTGEPGATAPALPRPPGHSYLQAAVSKAKENGGAAAAAANAIETLDDCVTWYQRQGLRPELADFDEKHALATLIGPADRPGVLELRDDLLVGISLVAPGMIYPDHNHPPEELYLALTDGEWHQDQGPWFAPGPNGIVYNTPNVLHGMRALDEPQLAVWCLPLP